MPDPFDELVAARRDQVGRELDAVTGGASLCSLSRSGGPVDGAKYLEGRLAVLMELGRLRRTAADGDPRALLEQTARSWRRELDDARELDRGPIWVAYRAGGVDEIEELLGRPWQAPAGSGGS